MSELILEHVVFKQTKLAESIKLVLKESAWDYMNYGVTQRAIDKYFGSGKKLTDLVKSEMLKKYGKTDISKLDPNEIANEIKAKADSAASKLMGIEFFDGTRRILKDGLLNGIMNAFVNSALTLIFTLNPEEAIKSFFRGFILGVLVEFLFKGFSVVYNEFKKRILKDPYAQPSVGETLGIILLTIVTFTTAVGLYAGQGPEYIIISILINIFLTTIMTILLNIKAISEKLKSYFNSKEVTENLLVKLGSAARDTSPAAGIVLAGIGGALAVTKAGIEINKHLNSPERINKKISELTLKLKTAENKEEIKSKIEKLKLRLTKINNQHGTSKK